jgi:16S rRNA (guanine527-N7)-methyltransferase
MSPDAALAAGIDALGLVIQGALRKQLLTYLALIGKWNQVYNLTAILDEREMVTQHLLDSLSIAPYLASGDFLDVGSGAGLPGIPVAIAFPDRDVTLLDSNQKKTAFLQQAVIELGLRNVTVCTARVEAWHPDRCFDVIASRAFSDLGEFIGKSRHLLSGHGVFAAMKGAYPQAEIERLPEEFRVRAVQRLAVPGLAAERHLVLVERAAS